MANMIGVNGVAQEIVKGWIGDANGIAQEIEAGWIGDINGIAQIIFSSGPGIFVAAGDSGEIAHSADGITWTVYEATLDGATTSYAIKSITYGSGVFVANMYGSSKNVLCYSEDGINFFTATTSDSLHTGSGGYKIAYGNGRFVAVPNTTASWGLYSLDGITWTRGGGAAAYSCSYANGKFFAMHQGGKSKCSEDGITWTALTGLSTSTSYGYDSGVVYAFGYYHTLLDNGNYYRSTDGVTWTQVGTHPTSTVTAYGMAYGNNVIAIMVYNKNLPECSYIDSSGYYSGAGLNVDSGGGAFKAVAFSDKFVAVGGASNGGYSADGKTWTQTVVSSTSITFNDVCYAVDGGGKAS